MDVRWTDEPGAGTRLGHISFDNPKLDGHRCPIIEVSGAQPGPRICVMAGVHINEASSIFAALSLASRFDSASLKGSLSIIPIVSTQNIFQYTFCTSPVEGRDLHWSYPGSEDGDFDECLAHALLTEWMSDADVLLDLHGGDLDERMARYVVVQSTGDAEFNARAEAMASCFDTPLVVALHASAIGSYGRCCTALAALRRIGLVSEAGDFGMADVESIAWHVEGVRQVAILLGMIDAAPSRRTDQQYLDRYDWIIAPEEGVIEKWFKPGDWLEAGAEIGVMRDCHGRAIAPVRAPASGYVTMQKSPLFVPKGHWIGAVASPRGEGED